MFDREYTVSEVAEKYRVTTTTVGSWIKSKRLVAIEHYGCHPKWTISEEALKAFDDEYVRRQDGMLRVIRQKKSEKREHIPEPTPQETDEDIRLIRGIKVLSDVLERNPYLKELILELADRA